MQWTGDEGLVSVAGSQPDAWRMCVFHVFLRIFPYLWHPSDFLSGENYDFRQKTIPDDDGGIVQCCCVIVQQ